MALNADQEQLEHHRKVEAMRADVELKRKQATWETPRNIALLMGIVGAFVAAIAGTLGYKIAQTPAVVNNYYYSTPTPTPAQTPAPTTKTP